MKENKIGVELKQSGKRPTTFALNLTIDYEKSHQTISCEVYEAFLPELRKLLRNMEID